MKLFLCVKTNFTGVKQAPIIISIAADKLRATLTLKQAKTFLTPCALFINYLVTSM